jgi:hypothetical protein
VLLTTTVVMAPTTIRLRITMGVTIESIEDVGASVFERGSVFLLLEGQGRPIQEAAAIRKGWRVVECVGMFCFHRAAHHEHNVAESMDSRHIWFTERCPDKFPNPFFHA